MSQISTSEALDVFQLRYDHTMEELKAAYRRVSMAVHPDRGGTPEMFHTVNQCYQHLLHELGFRTGTATHFDLKRSYEHHADMNPAGSDPSTYAAPGKKFDLTHFNEVYDKYKVNDGFSSGGYGKFFQSGVRNAAPESIPENQSFNGAFMSRMPAQNNMAIVVKPAPLLDKGSLPFTEIGLDGVDDYGAQVGDIQAFDCKQAYSEDSMANAFQNFNERDHPKRSVEQITAQRQRYFDEVWDEEAQHAYDLRHKQEEAEMARRRRDVMLRADEQAYRAHARCNQQMLGYQ